MLTPVRTSVSHTIIQGGPPPCQQNRVLCPRNCPPPTRQLSTRTAQNRRVSVSTLDPSTRHRTDERHAKTSDLRETLRVLRVIRHALCYRSELHGRVCSCATVHVSSACELAENGRSQELVIIVARRTSLWSTRRIPHLPLPPTPHPTPQSIYLLFICLAVHVTCAAVGVQREEV